MDTIGRWDLRVPEPSNGPADVPFWLDRLATDLSDVAKDNQGTLAGRPTSTVLAPTNTPGSYYVSTNEEDPTGTTRRRVYRDHGAGYDELATVPVTARMLDAQSTVPPVVGSLPTTGLYDGRLVRLMASGAMTTQGVRWLLRYNATSGLWEYEGGPPVRADWFSSDVGQNATAAAGIVQGINANDPAVTVPCSGSYDVDHGASMIAEADLAGTSSVGIGLKVHNTEPDSTNLTEVYAAVGSQELHASLMQSRRVSLSSGQIVKQRYTSTANGTFWRPNAWMKVRPVALAAV